jgi:thiol:disulfide interchange protein DsbD
MTDLPAFHLFNAGNITPLSRFMRLVLQAMFAMLCWLGLVWPAQAQNLLAPNTVSSEQVTAELLVHAPDGVGPGKPVWAGLQLRHAPDWHTYWRNSGDSGQPTELNWELPPGVTAGELMWPTPKKFPLGTLANYGYDGTVLLAVPLTVTPAFSGQKLTVGLNASWLVCRKECIPEEGSFRVSVPLHAPTALNGVAFESARDRAPKEIAKNPIKTSVSGQFIEIIWSDATATWQDKTLEFFPETPGLIEPGAPWTQQWEGNTWHARVPLSPMRDGSPTQLPLVLALAGQAHGEPAPAGVRSVSTVTGTWPPVQAMTAPGVSPALEAALQDNATRAAAMPAPANTGGGIGLVAALLGALLGGMILNLMPCVFPVLAIKVLAFAQHAEDKRAHRLAGLAYTTGVVLSFMALGGLLLALRAAGEQLGWGFQLQSPAVVAALATLFTVIALNLAGLFEFGSVLPSAVANLQARHPVADSFLTGVLATAIASPCTAPFMGASLGLAIALPEQQALAVFAMLGLGMALPYLAASWVPAVARALPRPGAWMNTLRQFLAFPIWATVVWLLWVLGQQSGIDGAAALLMLLVALTLLIWALGQKGHTRTVLAIASLAGLLWLLWGIGPQVIRPLPTAAATTTSAANASEGVHWEAWSPQRQAELMAQGRPVFVDFTAAWCVTCQYNKRTTLANADVLADVASHQVALLRADWTRRDPTVTDALAQLGRNGVPTYALYSGTRAPQVLSEVLSVDEVRAALANL